MNNFAPNLLCPERIDKPVTSVLVLDLLSIGSGQIIFGAKVQRGLTMSVLSYDPNFFVA